MKRKIVSIITGIVLVVTILSVLMGIITYWKFKNNIRLLREQAICVAQEYLEEKYEEEMIYVSHTCIYDKMSWVVTFSPKSNAEQYFSVHLYESIDTNLPISERFSINGVWEQ